MTKKQITVLISAFLISALLLSVGIYLTFIDKGYTDICFLDAGQGDACVIKTNDNHFVLIDGGDKNCGEHTLIPYLEYENIHKLDAVFLSHLHEDHLNGVLELIDKDFRIDTIYISVSAEVSELYDILKKATDDKKIPLKPLFDGNELSFGKVKLSVIASEYMGYVTEDENDNSLILRMDYGKNSILFTGDATKTSEAYLKDNKSIDADILKVGHHGSSGSSGMAFLSAVSPKLAIISVGRNNRYHLPSEKTLSSLKVLNIPVARTDLDGTITVTMTENKISDVNCSRERKNDNDS